MDNPLIILAILLLVSSIGNCILACLYRKESAAHYHYMGQATQSRIAQTAQCVNDRRELDSAERKIKRLEADNQFLRENIAQLTGIDT